MPEGTDAWDGVLLSERENDFPIPRTRVCDTRINGIQLTLNHCGRHTDVARDMYMCTAASSSSNRTVSVAGRAVAESPFESCKNVRVVLERLSPLTFSVFAIALAVFGCLEGRGRVETLPGFCGMSRIVRACFGIFCDFVQHRRGFQSKPDLPIDPYLFGNISIECTQNA